ncbi:MAG: class I SAM-dependent methyltransferase [Aerococcus sp.]|nr:class I SAM-dependent methyltransferase [Aerococcus sp.]
MAHQYFDDNTNLAHDEKTYQVTFEGQTYIFQTDSGVFSRQRLDFGSEVLLGAAVGTKPTVLGPILDLGCGYGPIGIVMAHEEPERVIEMVDVNERALDLAHKNAEANQRENVQIHLSSGYQTVHQSPYARILTNPPIRAGKQVVHSFITGATDHLKPGGDLLLVIQKKQGAPSAQKKMAEVFGNVERIALKKGYWVLRSQKLDDSPNAH